MTRRLTLKLILIIFSATAALGVATAQTTAPKFEVGGQFSVLPLDDNPADNNLCASAGGNCGTFNYTGGGGRFAYNVNRLVAIDSEINFFQKNQRYKSRLVGGHPIQVLAGVKVGKHFRNFGVFAKARPGVLSFSSTINSPLGGFTAPAHDVRRTHLNVDVGGGVEFYPTHRTLIRLDAGDTMIRYGEMTIAGAAVSDPGRTTHNFQFGVGAGFRF